MRTTVVAERAHTPRGKAFGSGYPNPGSDHASSILRAASRPAVDLARSLLRLASFRSHGASAPAALEEVESARRESVLRSTLAPLRGVHGSGLLCEALMHGAIRAAARDLHWLDGVEELVEEISSRGWSDLASHPQ